MKHIDAAIVGFVIALGLSACSQPVQVPSVEANTFAAEVDPIVENCLLGLSDNDFAKHTRDFDASMLDVVDETTFPQGYQAIIGVVGKYKSRKLTGVWDQAEFRIVYYEAQFDNDVVTVKVVFTRTDPAHKISGLWFDSPKLRATPAPD